MKLNCNKIWSLIAFPLLRTLEIPTFEHLSHTHMEINNYIFYQQKYVRRFQWIVCNHVYLKTISKSYCGFTFKCSHSISLLLFKHYELLCSSRWSIIHYLSRLRWLHQVLFILTKKTNTSLMVYIRGMYNWYNSYNRKDSKYLSLKRECVEPLCLGIWMWSGRYFWG